MNTWLTMRIIYLVILFMVTIYGLISFSKLLYPYKVLTILILLTFGFETAALIAALVFKNNQLVYHLFNFIEVFGLLYVFYLLYTKKVFKITAIILFSAYMIIQLVPYFKSLAFSSDFDITVKSILLMTASLLMFVNWFQDPLKEKLQKEPSFWFATIILFFFAINLLYWATGPSIFNVKSVKVLFNYILFYSNLVLYLFMGYVLYLNTLKNKISYE